MGIKVDYLSPTFYLTDFLVILFLVLFLSYRRLSLRRKNLFFAGFILVIFLINLLFSKNELAGLYGILKYTELFILGFVIANYSFKKKFLSAFSLGVIIQSAIGIAQFLNQGSLGGFFYFLGERTFNPQTPGIANASLNGELILRPYATFPHPNVLAGYLVLFMTFILLNFKKIKCQKVRLISYFSLLIGSICLALTLSRTAIIIFLLILAVTFIKKRKKIVVVPFSVLVILMALFSSRFFELEKVKDALLLRLDLVKEAITIFFDNPFLGAGINNFLNNSSFFWNKQEIFLQPVHNIYLLVLSQMGIVGFAIFIYLIYSAYKNIFSNKEKTSLFYILSAILILGVFDHYFLTLQQGQLLLAIFLGLSFNSQKFIK